MWSGWLQKLFILSITLCQRSWAPISCSWINKCWVKGNKAQPSHCISVPASPSSVIYNPGSPGSFLILPEIHCSYSNPAWSSKTAGSSFLPEIKHFIISQNIACKDQIIMLTISNIFKPIQKSEIWIPLPSAVCKRRLSIRNWPSGAPREPREPWEPWEPREPREPQTMNCNFAKLLSFFMNYVFVWVFQYDFRPPKHVLHLVWSVLGISTAIKTALKVAL